MPSIGDNPGNNVVDCKRGGDLPSANHGMTVLITGASRGIGLAFSRVFATPDNHLVLVSRDLTKLTEIARELATDFGVRVTTVAKDLTDPRAPAEIFEHLQQTGITIDVLVNNAGERTRGSFATSEIGAALRTIQINVSALTQLTRLALPQMLARGRGRILNVASISAFQPGPFMAVYYATKSFVLSFSEALSHELQGSGVTVTVLCPGATEARVSEKRPSIAGAILRPHRPMDTGTVARIGYDGLRRGKRIVIPGLRNRLLVWTLRFLPRAAVMKLTKAVLLARVETGDRERDRHA
jgi:short-subunit dehydrogenase